MKFVECILNYFRGAPPSVDSIIASFEKTRTKLNKAYARHTDAEIKVTAQIGDLQTRKQLYSEEAARALRINQKIGEIIE